MSAELLWAHKKGDQSKKRIPNVWTHHDSSSDFGSPVGSAETGLWWLEVLAEEYLPVDWDAGDVPTSERGKKWHGEVHSGQGRFGKSHAMFAFAS